MLAEEKLKWLVRLQKVNSQFDELYELRGDLPLAVDELSDIVEGMKKKQIRLEEEINGMKEFIAEKKEIIAQSEANIKKYEDQRENVKNNREFESINKEIEFHTLEARLAERRIKNTNDEICEKMVDWEDLNQKIERSDKILEQKRDELSRIVEQTKEREKPIAAAISTIESQIDPALLATFRRVRKNFRNGLAVVPITRGACGGCFSVVPAQMRSDIASRKKIIVCESCGRVLVDQPLYEEVQEG